MIEVKTYYITNKHERALVVDGVLLFRGEDRVYKTGEGLQKTPIYYFEEGYLEGLSKTGINFLHGEVIHVHEHEFLNLLNNES